MATSTHNRLLTSRHASICIVLLLMTLLPLIAGCGSETSGVGREGTVVGAACTKAEDCDQGSTCLLDGDFPQGTCSKSCLRQSECPAGSFCIDSKGGVCLLACTYNAECRLSYACKGKSRIEKDGEALVCIE